MDYYTMLRQLVEDNNGIISTREVTELGIPRTYLSEMVKQGLLERYERGIYISVTSNNDKMYCFQMRFAQVVFSHESALFLHHYIEKVPSRLVVTVRTGTNTKNLMKSGTRVHSIRSELFTLGEIKKETDFGRIVGTYDIERTICDVVRNRSKIENEIIVSVLKKYKDSPKKDFSRLFSYAENLKVAKILYNYLEFLR